MTVKVIVNGANGKMGALAAEAIEQDQALSLVARCDKDDDLHATITKLNADVVLDLTVASRVIENTKIIIDAGARPVIGTSGLLTEDIERFKEACNQKKLGGLIVPNFSIGAVLMMQFAAQAAQYFNAAEIIELHHERKEDAPSGTALRTAEMMAESPNFKADTASSNELVAGVRGGRVKDIPIHSIRLPGYVAHQRVIFGGQGESLTIQHDSIDRSSFMPGVLLACKRVMSLESLYVGLEKVL